MIKFWLVFLFIGTTLFSLAQKDPETKQLLKNAAGKALAYKTIQTKFEFIVNNAQLETEDNYSGELWIKGNSFKMSIDQTVTFCDGKNRWVYLLEANEVNISTIEKGEDLDPDELFLNEPLSIFTLYKKGFKYTTSGSQVIDDITYLIVDLSPEDLSKPYFKIKCWISENNDYYAIKYFQKDGTRITLQLIDFESNVKLKDVFFVFNPADYPNCEIIDLRE